MMTLNKFNQLVDSVNSVNEYADNLYDLIHIEITESPLFRAWGQIVDDYIRASTINTTAADLVNWYLFESDDKIIDGLDLNNPEDFYNYMDKQNYWK